MKRLRLALGYTQRQMLEALQDEKTPTLYENHINLFESGKREPDLPLLLRYARVAGVSVEMLIDDEMELPNLLPL
jgi:transcriptional regulator with XRE-family HTH domain